MHRASPVEIRKSLEIVELLKKAGIAFIPIPILNEEDKNKLVCILQSRLETIERDCKNDNAN